MNWLKTPDDVGFFWWRENAEDKNPFVRHIKRDHMGLYDVNSSFLTLLAIGGEWQRVAAYHE